MHFYDAFIDELVKVAAPYTYKDKYVTISAKDPKHRFFTGKVRDFDEVKPGRRFTEARMAEQMLEQMGGETDGMPPTVAAILRAAGGYRKGVTLRNLKSGKHSSIFTRTSPFGLIERVRYKFSEPKKRAQMIRDRAAREKADYREHMRAIDENAHKGPLKVGRTSIGYGDVNAGD